MQKKKKLKGMVITGVVGVCCRHGCFCSMVDLQWGERYANTDYAVMNALQDRKDLLWILLTYDIGCQYCINFIKRIIEEWPDDAALWEWVIRILVPKMHLYSHKDDCQYAFSLNYAKCVSRTHGEKIESLWAPGKELRGSTQEMNGGHRHDTLHDDHNTGNFRKNQELCECLQFKRSRPG
ncbi:hypothetical protein JAAARDRAFT_143577 [Jaapia argillacea MUCL 33604]|uniref:Uncharacterized protein n=1 Tax=Jaapia argillacea MUCL 33604 TaxID=933084 RepID=A0A067PFV7_9AGAM|nr:hypothetical protein JAAARDRAFT_143577 [Jaapia argillacea MUCL 33604]